MYTPQATGAESRDITTGEEKVLALLPNAYFRGSVPGSIWPEETKAMIRPFP